MYKIKVYALLIVYRRCVKMSRIRKTKEYPVIAVTALNAFMSMVICDIDSSAECVTSAYMQTNDNNGVTQTVLSDVRKTKLYTVKERTYFIRGKVRYDLSKFMRVEHVKAYPVESRNITQNK